ncbi:MAG: hypothetical protein II393_02300 [Cytophagales bacterium]|nr:hypothetical protein [Cytophagales bacterium]
MSLFKKPTYKASPFKGNYVFSNFAYGLYNLDTPRDLTEQLTSLAMTGGRNCWTEKGALVSQYGYNIVGQTDLLPDSENSHEAPFLLLDNDMSNTDVALITEEDTVYRYSELDGLKQFKTKLTDIRSQADFLAVYYSNKMFISTASHKYMFGEVLVDDPQGEDSHQFEDVAYVPITETPRTCASFSNYFSLYLTEEEAKYLWIDKQIALYLTTQQLYKKVIVIALKPNDGANAVIYPYIADFIFADNADNMTITEPVTIGEKSLYEIQDEFIFVPEDYDPDNPPATDTRVPLKPKLMAVALNRLWVVNFDNTIYYSQVGQLSKFNEIYGAGYFKGFYGDTSEVLSIEEYFSGVLITKQTGMFHLTLTTNQYSYSSVDGGVIASSSSDNYVNVIKINNITQKYAGDHVIIGDEVIAYDNSSGNLVQAAFVNYLGHIQQGGILLHGSELDAQKLGLTRDKRRKLVYSFKEEVLLFYYGDNLDKSLLITRGLSIYPREIDKLLYDMTMSFQGYVCVTRDGIILEGFKRGTIIPDISPVAEFEPICLRGNKLLCGSIMEFTELDGIKFKVATANAGTSEQQLTPYISQTSRDVSENLPNLIYSDTSINFYSDTVANKSKWASQKSSLTRLAAPLSGRDGLALRLEFEPNVSFCLTSIYFPDMSRGE